MNFDAESKTEMDELVSRFLTGSYESHELSELSDRLRKDPAAKVDFRGLLEIEASLMLAIGAQKAISATLIEEEMIQSAENTPPRIGIPASTPTPWLDSSIVRWLIILMVTGAFWVFFLPVWLFVQNRYTVESKSSLTNNKPLDGNSSGNQSNLRFKPSESSSRDVIENRIARWLNVDNCQWTREQPATGDWIETKRIYYLESGTAELLYTSGVRIRLSSPSIFSIDSNSSLSLKRGCLFASVSSNATGFQVKTPEAVVTDLGTEFGVYSELDSSSGIDAGVHVFKGLVSVSLAHGGAASESHLLEEGQSSTIINDGSIQSNIQSDKLRALQTLAHQVPSEDTIISPDSRNNERREIAIRVKSGTKGNQDWQGALANDFNVVRPITVHQLGAFDSDGDGFQGDSLTAAKLKEPGPKEVKSKKEGFNKVSPIVVTICSRISNANAFGSDHDASADKFGKVLAKMEFSHDSPGVLIGGTRFKPLPTSLELPVGTYSIISYGFGPENLNGNRHYPIESGPNSWWIDLKQPSISFASYSRHSVQTQGILPERIEAGPDKYVAGSFEYSEASPENSESLKGR